MFLESLDLIVEIGFLVYMAFLKLNNCHTQELLKVYLFKWILQYKWYRQICTGGQISTVAHNIPLPHKLAVQETLWWGSFDANTRLSLNANQYNIVKSSQFYLSSPLSQITNMPQCTLQHYNIQIGRATEEGSLPQDMQWI